MQVSLAKIKSFFTFGLVGRVTVSAVLLGYCFYIVDVDSLLAMASSIDLRLFLLAFFINILGTVLCKALLVWKLLSANYSVSILKVFCINLALRFYTIFLPRAAVAGIRWYKYSAISNSSGSLVLLSFEALVTFFVLALGGFAFSLASDDFENSLSVQLAFFALSLTILAVIVLLFFLPVKLIKSFTDTFLFRGRFLSRLKKHILTWAETAQEMKLLKLDNLAVIVASSLSSYFLFLVSSYILLQSLDIAISFIALSMIRSGVLLLAHLPITIAGLGLREIGFVGFFGLYGLGADSALAFAVASFMLQIGISMMGAIVELYGWITKAR